MGSHDFAGNEQSEADAVRIANDVAYGLSSYVWTENLGKAHRVAAAIEAGMCFVNSQNVRDLRQPFGGLGKSGFGPGLKAGGPNYVAQFMDFTDVPPAKADKLPVMPTLKALCEGLRAAAHPVAERILGAALSCERNHRAEFGVEHDHFKLVGQDNVRRYLSVGSVRVRVLVDGRERDLSLAGELNAASPPVAVRVDLDGARELTLVVEFGSGGDVGDHVNWVGARLVK